MIDPNGDLTKSVPACEFVPCSKALCSGVHVLQASPSRCHPAKSVPLEVCLTQNSRARDGLPGSDLQLRQADQQLLSQPQCDAPF